jgi:Metal binding domain of Ada
MLDEVECEQARVGRDRTYHGRFFTGVRTTSIYCRPVCPVRPARAANVCFYPSAAGAEAAGFRPCLRCQPETAPFCPAWNGSPTTAERALRLIENGALDEDGTTVEALASRDGCGRAACSPVTSEQASLRQPGRRACSARSGCWTEPTCLSRRSRCKRVSAACGASMQCSPRLIEGRLLKFDAGAQRSASASLYEKLALIVAMVHDDADGRRLRRVRACHDTRTHVRRPGRRPRRGPYRRAGAGSLAPPNVARSQRASIHGPQNRRRNGRALQH